MLENELCVLENELCMLENELCVLENELCVLEQSCVCSNRAVYARTELCVLEQSCVKSNIALVKLPYCHYDPVTHEQWFKRVTSKDQKKDKGTSMRIRDGVVDTCKITSLNSKYQKTR